MFHFKYRNNVKDLWQLNMYYIYGSFAGTINIVFTLSMLALMISFCTKVPVIVTFFIGIGVIWFPLIHPYFIWNKAKKSAKLIEFDTDIIFDNTGIHVTVDNKHEDIQWNKVVSVMKKPTLMIIYTDAVHGYILTDRILGDEKKAFREFVLSKVNK